MMHEFSSSVNKVNKAVAKVRTIGDRLPLSEKAQRETMNQKAENFDLTPILITFTRI